MNRVPDGSIDVKDNIRMIEAAKAAASEKCKMKIQVKTADHMDVYPPSTGRITPFT